MITVIPICLSFIFYLIRFSNVSFFFFNFFARLSRQRLSGRLGATTTLDLHTGTSGSLLDALQTQSEFAVRDAVGHGVDLARAVKTVGLSRGGETRLDTLAGQVATRGRAVQLNNLVASSGLLTASGQVATSPSQALRGRVQVHLGPAAVVRPWACRWW